jgi:hypothetical protein
VDKFVLGELVYSVNDEGDDCGTVGSTLKTPRFCWREEHKVFRPAYDCVYILVWV